MIMLSEQDLVRSIAEQTERSAAVIGQTDFSSASPDTTAIIVSSLSNIFDSALVVTALENEKNDRDECYRHAKTLVLNSPKVSADSKRFIRQIQDFRSRMALGSENGSFDRNECLDFLNAYDCFMFGFFKNSMTVKTMSEDKSINLDFVSFRNIVEKLLKKEMLARKEASAGSSDIASQLAATNQLLEKILAENAQLNRKISELSDKIDRLIKP